jgi:hypothetical protein
MREDDGGSESKIFCKCICKSHNISACTTIICKKANIYKVFL